MRKFKIKYIFCFVLSILLFTLVAYYQAFNIPTTIFIREGEKLESSNIIKLVQENTVSASSRLNNQSKNVNVSLLGILKVKTIEVKSVPEEIKLYPGGQPVGVKLKTKGVLVIALSDVETSKGKVTSPGAQSGIEIGDNIIEINGDKVTGTEKTSSLVNVAEGKDLNVIIDRQGKTMEKVIKPIKDINGKYKIGLWVRDSTAGVGTLTFYDDDNKIFAALGHPITDVDTGSILPLGSGQIINSSIVSVRKGVKRAPGELKGIFIDEDIVLGKISRNSECGIFGKANLELKNKYAKKMPIALRHEIKEGPAKIYTTIDGSQPKTYDIVIEKLLPQSAPGPKSMIIKVTDKELLNKTGGIVQGMSGSPIIQDNKIVGAVTHVLINKPDTGYGIYIEWMLKEADMVKYNN
ncbi:stage IV sporulation protein B [Clostridium pascui]|uniref:SpoIVB peptidase n=1 Tax=Clostridium pascui TaxID=46609 RepID=UPI00195ECD28|nr:SpoIVB peptidase [Clostridium pascui]MBM7869196.1 stage IV sporulation protein B [Clostridium pascui]